MRTASFSISPRAVALTSSVVLPSTPVSQRRTMYVPYFCGPNRFRLPGPEKVFKRDLEAIPFFDTKSRKQWDYNGVDESINIHSPFRKAEDRGTFHTGPRPDNYTCNEKPGYDYPPHFKRLHEHFDDYTQPNVDKKIQAVKAAREQWDADEFYYPGEAWKRNRPSFRSVPQEILNRQSWYHWSEMITKQHEICATARPRQYNPIWPPPGYKVPKFWTKREWQFGVEEPGLVVEIERYFWFKNWIENNSRHAPMDWVITLFLAWMLWYVGKSCESCGHAWKCVMGGMWYPGRFAVRSFGEPKDPNKENWWWQEPLETFPNQGEIWFMKESRFGYINHIKQRDEQEKVERALAGLEAQTA